MKKSLIAVIILCFSFLHLSSNAADLNKADAKKILENRGATNVQIITILNNCAAASGWDKMYFTQTTNSACVIAIRKVPGSSRTNDSVFATFFYDKELGWFDFNWGDKYGEATISTTKGVQKFSVN